MGPRISLPSNVTTALDMDKRVVVHDADVVDCVVGKEAIHAADSIGKVAASANKSLQNLFMLPKCLLDIVRYYGCFERVKRSDG